jgi:methionine synthase I (cobalamin-dependent)
MTSFAERQKALFDVLATRILVLDGAMGTMLQQRHLTTEDRGGAVLQDCP